MTTLKGTKHYQSQWCDWISNLQFYNYPIPQYIVVSCEDYIVVKQESIPKILNIKCFTGVRRHSCSVSHGFSLTLQRWPWQQHRQTSFASSPLHWVGIQAVLGFCPRQTLKRVCLKTVKVVYVCNFFWNCLLKKSFSTTSSVKLRQHEAYSRKQSSLDSPEGSCCCMIYLVCIFWR